MEDHIVFSVKGNQATEVKGAGSRNVNKLLSKR